jgi:iron complex outermembrane recepter protein
MKTMVLFTAYLFLTSMAFAQTDTTVVPDTSYLLPPVTVYPMQARERETPVTFSNLTNREIRERYSVQDIPVLLSEMPSMISYSDNGSGIGYNYVNLRGFDQRRLSIMINGVPQNDPEDHNVYWIDFPDLLADIDQIQVQRGAGSAFYGPPAIGGSINLITNPFDSKPGVTVESMLGFQEFGDSSFSLPLTTKKYSLSVNSGVVNQRYLFYGKLAKLTSTGYRANSWVDLNSYFLGAIRIDKNMTTRVHLFGGPLNDALSYYGLPKFAIINKILRRQNLNDYWEVDSTGNAYSYAAPRRKQEVESFSQPHYELIHDWQINPTLSITNTLFFYSGEGYYDYDASWADTSMLRLGTTYGIPTVGNPANALVRAFVGNRQWGWLPHISLDHGTGTLTLGTEVRIHRSTHWGKIQYAEQLPPNYDPDYHFYEYNGEKDIFSLYFHEMYRVTPDITMMGDLQLTRIRYGIRNEKYLGNSFSIPYTFVNPRIGINYIIDDRWSSYLSIAYTSREPRLKNLYGAEFAYAGDTPQFASSMIDGVTRYNYTKPFAKPEHLLDVEVGAGFKSENLRFSTDVYWMEFTDELLESGEVDLFGEPITWNANRTRHIGIEAEGAVTLTPHLSLSGNVTYSKNTIVHHRIFTELQDSIGNPVYVEQTLDNNPIGGFPNLLCNLRLTWHNDHLTSSLVSKYVGPFYTDNFKNNKNKNDDYFVVNFEILYHLPPFVETELTLRGEVRNIFNRLYSLSGEGKAFFPAAERNYLIGLTINF